MSLLGALSNIPGVNSVVSGGIKAFDAVTPGALGNTFANNVANPNVNYQGQLNPGFVAPQAQDNAPSQQAVLGANTGSGYTAGVNDPSTLSAYDQSIGNVQSAIGNLQPAQDVFNSNLQGGYQNALNNIAQQQAQDTQTYQGNKNQTGQNFVQAKNQIGNNASGTLTSLLRLLGSRGAGGSSDYQFAAPNAVATQAAQQRSGAGQTYAQNNQSLDTNFNNYLSGVQRNKGDLQTQLTNQQNQESASVASNKANLLQQLASLNAQKAAATGGSATTAAQPFLDQANQLISQATQLGQQAPVFNVAPQTYTAPSLSSYEVNPFAPVQASNPSAGADQATPYLSLLQGLQKNKYATNLGA